MSAREYWIVLIDKTPDQPGSSNREFRVEHAPVKASDFEPLWKVIEIIHVREVI